MRESVCLCVCGWAEQAGADPGGVDGVASHPPFTCSFVRDTMGIGLSVLASHTP